MSHRELEFPGPREAQNIDLVAPASAPVSIGKGVTEPEFPWHRAAQKSEMVAQLRAA